MPERAQSGAATYNHARRVLFSKLHGQGRKAALEYLEGLSSRLIRPSHVGLTAEFHFYTKYGQGFQLTPSLDAGDKNDFVGIVRGKIARIDVTTNLDYKKLADYESFQREGHDYYIALMDGKSHELADIVDINFPFCEDCDARLFDALLLLPPNRDSEGFQNWVSTPQEVIQICPSDPDSHSGLVGEAMSPWTYDFEWFIDNLPSYEEYEEVGVSGGRYRNYEEYVSSQIKEYALENVRYYRKFFKRNIVACGSPGYMITNPADGDGFWGTQLFWRDPLVADYLEDFYEGEFY